MESRDLFLKQISQQLIRLCLFLQPWYNKFRFNAGNAIIRICLQNKCQKIIRLFIHFILSYVYYMIQEINNIFFHSPIASLNFVSVSILSKNATTAPTVIETTKIVASKAKMRTIAIFSLDASWYSFLAMVLNVLTGYLKLFVYIVFQDLTTLGYYLYY